MTISGSGSTLIIFYKDNEQAESLITNVSLKKTKHPYRFVEASFNKCLALFKKKGE
jgi:homoserine kinase